MAEAETNACRHCENPFIKVGRGYKRRSCKLLFPETEGFFCEICFSKLKRQIKRQSDPTPTSTTCPAQTASGFQQRKKLRPCVSTPTKKIFASPPKISGTGVNRCVTPVLKALRRCEYRPAVGKLMKWAGFKRTINDKTIELMRNELKAYVAGRGFLCKKISLDIIGSFQWKDVFHQLQKKCPLTVKFLCGLISKHTQFEKAFIPTLTLVFAIILNAREVKKCRLLQNLISLQMYICGSPQKLMEMFNKLHLCAGVKGTTSRVDSVIKEYQDIMSQTKKGVQKYLSTGCRDVRPKRKLSFSGQPEKAQPLGYTFCWDNTQIDVKARHQEKEKNVWMMLWALCYAAKNRVRTVHLPDSTPLKKAIDLPISTFLPSPAHSIEIQEQMRAHLKESLINNLAAFKGLHHPGLPRHRYWEEMSMKSEVINLGVLQENPSTTAGAIAIMDFLSRHIPLHSDGRPYPIITHCDGGAFERMVSARKVRAPDRSQINQLLGIEMSAQEFHKRGINLQIIMDNYFNGSSLNERGTLANIKSVMGHHSVKTKVMDAFNHVEDMFDVCCDGYACLLAMELMGFASVDEELPPDTTVEGKIDALTTLVDKMVNAIWLQPTEFEIKRVVEAVLESHGSTDICCAQDVPGETITCSNPGCKSGGIFHVFCIEAITGEEPPKDDDWWCSPDCEGFSKFCTCRRFIENADMVECLKGKRCQYGQWFHLDCAGLTELPGEHDRWFCEQCMDTDGEHTDGVQQYSTGLLWMLLNDRLRRTAIRTGNGPMMMDFWVDDGVQFWNHNHYKYLILMHRMTAGTNGWLSERQAADLVWNRTVNLTGSAGHNIPMDKYNEFLNCDFKENLKTSHGTYTDAQTRRSSHLAGQVSRDLLATFHDAKHGVRKYNHCTKAHKNRVAAFIEEYHTDKLFSKITGRHHRHFPDFNAKKLHQQIKNHAGLKARLLDYSLKLDRARYAAEGI